MDPCELEWLLFHAITLAKRSQTTKKATLRRLHVSVLIRQDLSTFGVSSFIRFRKTLHPNDCLKDIYLEDNHLRQLLKGTYLEGNHLRQLLKGTYLEGNRLRQLLKGTYLEGNRLKDKCYFFTSIFNVTD